MKNSIISSIIVILIGCFFAYMQYIDFFYTIDRSIMDFTYQKESMPNPNIKIIKIDEKTLEAYGAFGTWSRDYYAQLVEKLETEGKPQLIGFDVIFTGQIEEAGDVRFANACEKAGNVVVVNNIVFQNQLVMKDGVVIGVDSMNVERIEQPYPLLKKVTRQGFSKLVLDNDGKVRKSMLKVEDKGVYYDSFSSVIAQEYARKEGIKYQYPKIDANHVFGFTFTAKSDMYEEVSFVDVLAGKVDVRAFKDCIILVGAHAPGMQDAYNVAIEYGKQMYGVEIHANLIEAFINDKIILEINKIAYCFYLSIVIVHFILIMKKITLFQGIFVFLIFSSIHLIGANILYDFGYEVPLISLPVACFSLFVLKIIMSYFKEFRHRQITLNVFKRYVTPSIVEQIVNDKNQCVDLAGEIRDIAVMFVDIRGFTPISEILTPKEVVEVLNSFFNLTASKIFENFGTLDKYIGDATMAIFNSPFDLEDYEFKAIKTAIEIRRGELEIAEEGRKKYGIEIGFGIGIHCGNAVIGNIGCEQRLDFTAIGDCVNTASRIEGHAKAGQILISEEMAMRLNHRIHVQFLDEVKLKGKMRTLKVYEVIDIIEGEEG